MGVPTSQKNHGLCVRDTLSVLVPGDPWMPPGPRIITPFTT